MATTRKYGWDYWGWNGGDSYFAYIRLRHPSDMETINSRIDQMLEKYIPQEDKDKYNLQVEILEGNTYSLTNGNKGYVRMISQVGRWNFIEPKYYYTPIATEDLTYNPNLVQNQYWKQ